MGDFWGASAGWSAEVGQSTVAEGRGDRGAERVVGVSVCEEWSGGVGILARRFDEEATFLTMLALDVE